MKQEFTSQFGRVIVFEKVDFTNTVVVANIIKTSVQPINVIYIPEIYFSKVRFVRFEHTKLYDAIKDYIEDYTKVIPSTSL